MPGIGGAMEPWEEGPEDRNVEDRYRRKWEKQRIERGMAGKRGERMRRKKSWERREKREMETGKQKN